MPLIGLLRAVAAALVILQLLAWPAGAADRRVALVVGNARYLNAPLLDNPANDAQLIAQTLQSLGFTLVGGGAQLNLDKAGFDRAVRSFGQALQGADIAMFYYAGHGMQVGGTNWLVPVDARLSRPQDLEFVMTDAGAVLRQMQAAGTRLNVVVLDACRDNPFATGTGRGMSRGLATMQAPEGTLISYATQPGSAAEDGDQRDSPYTTALAGALRQPGLDLFRMFNRVGVEVKRATAGRQIPWVSNSPIEGEFYFAGPGPGAPAATAQPAPPPPPPKVASLIASTPRLSPQSQSGTSQSGTSQSGAGQSGASRPAASQQAARQPVASPPSAQPPVASLAPAKASPAGKPAASQPLVSQSASNLVAANQPAPRPTRSKRDLGGADDGGVDDEVYQKGKVADDRADYAEALRWYGVAAQADNAAAQFAIGSLYFAGRGVPRDDAEAMRWYRKAADQGFAPAQSGLGYFYQSGLGVPQDLAEAVRWYRLAADQGLAQAQANLGYLYQNGLGVPQDYAEALRWHRLAADQGNVLAQNSLGNFYQNGLGVAQDYTEAMHWYRKAADQGNADAQNNVGMLYRLGLGVTKDLAEARHWFRLSALQGNSAAERNLLAVQIGQ